MKPLILASLSLMFALPAPARDPGWEAEMKDVKEEMKRKAAEARKQRADAEEARKREAEAAAKAGPAPVAPGCADGELAKKIGVAFNRAADDIKGKVVWGNSAGGYGGNEAFWNVLKAKDLVDLKTDPTCRKWPNCEVPAGILEIRKDKKPSEGITDMFSGSSGKYKVECVSAMQILMYKTILDLVSPGKFDKIFADGDFAITISFSLLPGYYAPNGIRPYLKENGDATKPADAAFLAALTPGTIVYFKNPGTSPSNPYAGENAVFLGVVNGERQYFAHPFGKIGEAKLIEDLNKHKNDASAAPAYMHQGTTCITPKLAELAP